MDTLKWRGRARIVAYVDLILSSMALLMVIIATIGASIFTVVVNDPDFKKRLDGEGDDPDSPKIDPQVKEALATSAWVLWICVALLAVFTFVQLWAAVKLMNGTDVGRDYHDAMSRAATWRNVTVVFLIFQLCGSLVTGTYISLAFGTFMRGIFLFVVLKFMQEINLRLTPPPRYGPTMVTVEKQ